MDLQWWRRGVSNPNPLLKILNLLKTPHSQNAQNSESASFCTNLVRLFFGLVAQPLRKKSSVRHHPSTTFRYDGADHIYALTTYRQSAGALRRVVSEYLFGTRRIPRQALVFPGGVRLSPC